MVRFVHILLLFCIYREVSVEFKWMGMTSLVRSTYSQNHRVILYSYLMEVGAIVQNIWPQVKEMIKWTIAQGQRHKQIILTNGQKYYLLDFYWIKQRNTFYLGNNLLYPRLDKNVGFWLVDDPLVQNPCYRLVVT